MDLSHVFWINSILFGIGLAMDAFSISLVNGINDPHMIHRKGMLMAMVFAVFQGIMPVAGWVVAHTLALCFGFIERLLPYVAYMLLVYIGTDMIRKAGHVRENAGDMFRLGPAMILLQGISTSLDAFSVGFAIADYRLAKALSCAAVIASVTFAVCLAGVFLGRRLGAYFAGRSRMFGGAVLIAIGLEILIKG